MHEVFRDIFEPRDLLSNLAPQNKCAVAPASHPPTIKTNKRSPKMYITVTRTMFHESFRYQDRKDQLGDRKCLDALFDYLESLDEDNGAPIELDVIALCGDYAHCTLAQLRGETGFETVQELEELTEVIYAVDEQVLYRAY